MTQRKILSIIVIIIGIVLIGIGVLVSFFSLNKTTGENKITSEEKITILHNNIEYSNYKFITKEGINYFKITVKNLKEEPTEIKPVRITIYNADNKRIAWLDAMLPVLQPNEKVDLEVEHLGERITESYTINVEETGTPIMVG